MENLLGCAIALGIIAIFVLAVMWMVRSAKREKERRKELASAAGFVPLDPPPADLLEKIRALRKQKNQKYELRNVAYKRTSSGDMYLYDLWDTGGDDSSVTTNMGLALVLPGRSLPRFAIFPRLQMEGRTAALANRFLDWIVSKFGERVEIPGRPDLNEKFLFSGDDAVYVLELLEKLDLQKLADYDNVVVEGGGEIVSVSRYTTGTKSYKTDAETYNAWINKGTDALRIFEGLT